MKRHQARQSILTTASRLFYKQGYSNTGINQIIEEAGICKATLYQHFRSKEDLLIAYFHETGLATTEALKNAAQKGATPMEKILAVFDYLEELVARVDFYGCHFLNIVYEMPDGEQRVREQIKKQKDAVRELFRDIVETPNAPNVADDVYTLFEGALIAHKIHQASWPITSAKNTLRKLF